MMSILCVTPKKKITQKLAQMEAVKVICFGKSTICLLHGGIFLDTTLGDWEFRAR